MLCEKLNPKTWVICSSTFIYDFHRVRSSTTFDTAECFQKAHEGEREECQGEEESRQLGGRGGDKL